jgi:hypothetical protein
MFWAKKNIELGDYDNFLDHFNEHKPAYPKQSAEFIIVSKRTADPKVSTFYVVVADEGCLLLFDRIGFERVHETELPKVVDLVHAGDEAADAFKERFKMREP